MRSIAQVLSENNSKKRLFFWVTTVVLFSANWIWIDELKLNYPSSIYSLSLYVLVVGAVFINRRMSVPLALKVVVFFVAGWVVSLILHISLWAIFDAVRFEKYFQESLENEAILDGLLFQFKASFLLGGGVLAALVCFIGEALYDNQTVKGCC
jgi:hypothetical protein